MNNSDANLNRGTRFAGPPTKHQQALMIWIAVFPTLTFVNPTLGDCKTHTLQEGNSR